MLDKRAGILIMVYKDTITKKRLIPELFYIFFK